MSQAAGQPVVRLEVHRHRLARESHPLRAQGTGARLRLRPPRLLVATNTLLNSATLSRGCADGAGAGALLRVRRSCPGVLAASHSK